MKRTQGRVSDALVLAFVVFLLGCVAVTPAEGQSKYRTTAAKKTIVDGTVVEVKSLAKGKIVSVDFKTARDSTGRQIKRVTIVTVQSTAPVWGTLTLNVLVTDKDGTSYFGKCSFSETLRANAMTSVNGWVFNVVIDQMSSPDIEAYYVKFTDNANGAILAEKMNNVSLPKTWLEKNQGHTPIPVIGESNWVIH